MSPLIPHFDILLHTFLHTHVFIRSHLIFHNYFKDIGLEDTLEEEFTLRTPITFLDVFKKALSNKGKGNENIGEHEKVVTPERVFLQHV
jgi:hypothetical protein